MAVIGLASALMVTAVGTLWLIVKAGTWQIQSDYNESEHTTQAPRVVLDRGLSVFRLVVLTLLLSEFGDGLAAWLTDAYGILIQLL